MQDYNDAPVNRASFRPLDEIGEKKALTESTRRNPNVWTSQSCFLSSNWFFRARASIYY